MSGGDDDFVSLSLSLVFGDLFFVILAGDGDTFLFDFEVDLVVFSVLTFGLAFVVVFLVDFGLVLTGSFVVVLAFGDSDGLV